MSWALWGSAIYLALNAVLYIGKIGQPREPLKPVNAAIDVAVFAYVIVVICLAAWRLR